MARLSLLLAFVVLLAPGAHALVLNPQATGGWVAAWIQTDGFLDVRARVTSSDDATAIAAVYREDLSLVAMLMGPLTSGNTEFALGAAHSASLLQAGPSGWSVGVRGPAPAGRYLAVMIATGDVSSWSWEVGDGEVVAVEEGTDVIYSNGNGFRGGPSATVSAPAARSHAGIDARYPLDVSGVFLGSIGQRDGLAPVNASTMTVLGPHGERACFCRLPHVTGPEALTRGHYEVAFNGARADPLGQDGVIVGADVQVPPLPS